MARATTAASGDPSPKTGSSARPSSPTGPRTGSASSRQAAPRTGIHHRRRLARSRRLFAFDRGLQSRYVAGADEAGRGCLAGPLVAAAVLIDYEGLSHSDRRALSGLHDSKQMTEERRVEIYPAVLRAAERVCVVVRSAAGIDRRGLHNTNIEALSRALEGLAPGDDAISLVDGFTLPRCRVLHRRVVGGDATSAAIAAASVVAKVTRDRYMREAAVRHPGWGFEEHVGYSTPEHREAIDRLGLSPLHRRSFQSVAYSQLALA
ncbi:MAG: ribonuclease HII [Syntrophothermus sp.]